MAGTVVVFLAALMVCSAGADTPICCTPDQWEATMFWDNGNAFLDDRPWTSSVPGVGTVFTYINGSLTTAYDFTNGRTFINASVLQISPLIPKPVLEHTTLIRDYRNGVEYQFGAGGGCDKTKLDPLKRHCVPENATPLGAGFLGKEQVPVSTYAYTLTDYPYLFQSTVKQKDCSPVHVMYLVQSSESGSGAVYSLAVSDVTSGIKDPAIFDLPPQCRDLQVKGNIFSRKRCKTRTTVA